jgi:DNA-binding beta-propeller fold protein YncE
LRRVVAIAAAALAGGALAPAAAHGWVVEATWGKLGKGRGEFGSGVLGGGSNRQWDSPGGIAVAPDGSVVVVDVSNNRYQRFARNGRYLGQYGRRGRDAGFTSPRLVTRFYQPEGVDVDPSNGSVYVADAGNDRVMKHRLRGGFRGRLGHHGSYPGQLVQPWDVAVGPREVYVIDQGNYQIDRFSKSGRFLGSFGRFGRGRGEFVTPYSIDVNAAGNLLYVADHIKRQVMVFTPAGVLVTAFGTPGTGGGRFLRPAGVAVGPDGTVFVADRCNRAVLHFTAEGRYLESIGRGTLDTPTFVAVDRTGDLFVSDHHRVVRFGQGRAIAARPASHNRINIQCSGVN